MAENKEENNKKIGIAVSVGLHVLMLLLFFFIMAWRAPDPPLPEYGIQLNFGLDKAGYGDKQPTTPASKSPQKNTDSEAESSKQQVEEKPVEEVVPQPVTETKPTVSEPKQDVVSSPMPSPVAKEEVKKEVKKETAKPTEEPKKEADKPAVKPATYPSDNNSDGKGGTPANHGDRKGETGDQGSKEGSLDSRALYGQQGGGQGGPQLSISGWRWDDAPDKKDPSDENGFVVFKFVIDEQGYVISVEPEQSTVSPRVAQFYKEQLMKTTFSPTRDNAVPASRTTGKVTFIIKSK